MFTKQIKAVQAQTVATLLNQEIHKHAGQL